MFHRSVGVLETNNLKFETLAVVRYKSWPALRTKIPWAT